MPLTSLAEAMKLVRGDLRRRPLRAGETPGRTSVRDPWLATARSAMAIVAHPDDIEFMAAGTLLLLEERGYAIHYMTVASGNCGSMTMDGRVHPAGAPPGRARDAAKLLGAQWHPPLCDDMEIVYEARPAAAAGCGDPRGQPFHHPDALAAGLHGGSHGDLAARGVRGVRQEHAQFRHRATRPVPLRATSRSTTGCRTGCATSCASRSCPTATSNVSAVHAKKREALAIHASQKQWLDDSQGFDSYLVALDEMSAELGNMAGGPSSTPKAGVATCTSGSAQKDVDPLAEVLREVVEGWRKRSLDMLEAVLPLPKNPSLKRRRRTRQALLGRMSILLA